MDLLTTGGETAPSARPQYNSPKSRSVAKTLSWKRRKEQEQWREKGGKEKSVHACGVEESLDTDGQEVEYQDVQEDTMDTHAMEECQEGDDEYWGDECQWSGTFVIMEVVGNMTDAFWNQADMPTGQVMGMIDSGASASGRGLSWLSKLRGTKDTTDLLKSEKCSVSGKEEECAASVIST